MVFQDNFLKRMLLKMKVLYSQINADISLETIECDKVSITTKINQYFKSHRICREFEQLIEREFDNGAEKPTDNWNMVHISHSFKKWKKFMIDNHAKNYENNMCILRDSFDIWKEFIKEEVAITTLSPNKNVFQIMFEMFSKTILWILCIK